MKKLSNILVTLGVIIFLLSFGMKSEVVGQPCTQVKDTLVVDSCLYEVTICVYCGAAYPGYVAVDSVRQISGCTTSFTYNEVLQTVYKKVMASQWYNYCQYNAPPCSGTERKEMEVEMYICWRARLEYASIAQENRYVFYPCNYDDYCEVEYSYCVDSLGVLQYTISDINPNFDLQDLGCSLEAEDVSLPEFPMFPNGSESDCFILHTPCNLDGFNWNAP